MNLLHKKTLSIGIAIAALTPFIASAQQLLYTVDNLLIQIKNIVDRTIPLLMALALAAFFYGLVKYIWGGSSDGSKVEARRLMLGGLLALFVMASVWGLVYLIAANLGVSFVQTIPPPRVGN